MSRTNKIYINYDGYDSRYDASIKGADENDRLEQAGMDFHNRVYEGYLTLAKTDKCIEVVNGRQTPDEIFADVLEILKKRNCL